MEEDKSVTEELLLQQNGTNQKNEGDSYLHIILFYLMGTVCFMPQGFYVTANEYWMYKFRDPTLPFNKTDTVNKTTLQKNFTAYAGIALTAGMVTFLFITIVLSKKIDPQKRILGGMVSMLLSLMLTLLFIFVDTDSWQTGFFVVALVIGGLFSGSSAILIISVFSLVSKFSPRCTAAQLAGQSICGIFSALIQIIALLAASSVKVTACLFFTVAIVTVGSTMLIYLAVENRSEYFRSKLEELRASDENPRPKVEFAMVKKVVGKLALIAVSLVLCMGSTIILHSGLTSLIESSGKGTSVWSNTYFVPVCVFLSFNTFEFIGREVSNHISLLKNKYVIFATSVVRLALFPLILLCNLQPRHYLPVVFHEDAYFIIFVALLALSNGYVGNMSIVALPEYLEKEEMGIGTGFIIVTLISFLVCFAALGGLFVNLI